MSYVTQEELIAAYGEKPLIELTDRAEPPAGEIDTAVIERAIADTDALIDGFVGARYRLPMTDVPALLRQLAQPIVFHKLHIDAVSDKVKADYDDARRTLEWIAAGKVKLNVAGIEPKATAGEPAHCAAPRTDLTGYCP